MEIWNKRCAKEYVRYEIDRENGKATKYNLYLNHRLHKQKDVSALLKCHDEPISAESLKVRGYKLKISKMAKTAA